MTLYTKEEAAAILKISKRTLERLMSTGEIRGYKVGGSVRISDEQIDFYLRGNLTPVHVSTMSKPGRKRQRKTASDRDLMHYVPGMNVV